MFQCITRQLLVLFSNSFLVFASVHFSYFGDNRILPFLSSPFALNWA